MENQKQGKKVDFTIIFEEIKKYKNNNPDFEQNLVEHRLEEETKKIREFGEICDEISSQSGSPIIFKTFS